jgi:phthiocerol/phenolphthiocerol synthesis type-I polyketide synthase C
MSANPSREPIAIIGIGCRFPGGVSDPASFWKLLQDGIDAIGEIPRDRFDAEALYMEGAPAPGRIGTRRGGFLTDIDRFDARFFGISPREADRLDPQQRLLLEVSYEAFEDGGQPADTVLGSRTGVFVGLWAGDYERRASEDPEAIDLYSAMGGGRYAASGRISYTLGLQGPSLTVDTACSSSLVAVHLALQSLHTGECEMALAGGVNVILQPYITIAYSQSGMLAPDGRCKFGDARGDGYVRSEGAGMVLLKPLSRARADGDRIYAVIRGSAVNNDGRRGDSLVKPAQVGQEELLRLAYRDAGIPAGTVHYVEAHGTGTKAGDPTELGALGAVLAEGRPTERPCPVGSVKSHFGHTEAAAGVAGLIKAALVLQHREIPATLHLHEPNPRIPWEKLPLFIPRETLRIPDEARPAYAGVNSFGISGTNAHVVLEEAPAAGRPGAADVEAGNDDQAVLMPLSARSLNALKAQAQRCMQHLSLDDAAPLVDQTYSAGCRRSHHEHRLAVVARDPSELSARLQAFRDDSPDAGTAVGAATGTSPRVVFVFPGQGSQWVGMGRQLLREEPVFRAALEECEAAMRPCVEWSLLEQLAAAEGAPGYLLDRIDVIQPTLVALDIALDRLWRSWGITPAAVVGHSMGEVAAAYAAGALSLEDAMHVICLRSRLMRRTSGQGAMAVVELERPAAEAALAGYGGQVTVAASNGPLSTVLSGEPAALNGILHALEERGVFCRRVNVDVASHSPQMEPLRTELQAELQALRPRATSIDFYSTVLAGPTMGERLNAAYWSDNLRQPVLFGETVERLIADGHAVFVEISPHPVLVPAVQQMLQHAGSSGIAVGSLRREGDERAMLLQSLGQLYVAGCQVAWEVLYPTGRFVSLPTYPWQRERHWYEPAAPRTRTRAVGGAHPLLQEHHRAATGAAIWEGVADLDRLAYLADHRVRGQVVLPAAAYLEMALAAAENAAEPITLADFVFEEALFVEAAGAPLLQLVAEPEHAGSAALNFFSHSEAEGSQWTRRARGRLTTGETSTPELIALTGEGVAGEEHYRQMAARGLQYGPAFRTVRRFWKEATTATAMIELDAAAASNAAAYRIHPCLLDAALQLLLQTIDESADTTETWVPVSVARLRLYRRPTPAAPLRGRAQRRSGPGELEGEVALFDTDGAAVLHAEGVRFQRLGRQGDAALRDWHYQVEWRELPPPEAVRPASGSWLILADRSGVADALASHIREAGGRCLLARAGVGFRVLGPDEYELDPERREDFDRILVFAGGVETPLSGVVHLWSLDAQPSATAPASVVEAAQRFGTASLLPLAQALAAPAMPRSTRLFVTTAGAQAAATGDLVSGIAHAPLWGMAAVAMQEHPELGCTCVDLDPAAPEDDVAALYAELHAADGPDRVALRGGTRYAASLVRSEPAAAPHTQPHTQPHTALPEAYQVVTRAAGVLDNLGPQATPRPGPARGQVEIEVRATGLNFMNVLSAMGMYPGYPNGLGPLGIECAGCVARVGEGVEEFVIGQEVVAFALHCLGSHVCVDARLAAPKPAALSFAAAATIPISFLTAHYALEHLGRLEQGERVLIHSATGGVGLAALQIARRVGAEVFATAGSEEKREYLRALGVEHVFDSRSLHWAGELLERTGGEGVDLVLNSLSGEAIARGLAVLRPYGRFVEIGKRDIHDDSRIGLLPFRNQLSYFAVDLERGSRERPALLGRMLRRVAAAADAGEIEPLPARVFTTREVADAFRHMAQARHIGKVVVATQTVAELADDIAPAPVPIRSDATYLITGGLGGLGLEVARWMVARGARHLALVQRREPDADAREAVRELGERGADVRIERADVAHEADLAAALARIGAEMPPLRGVVHAAGVLDDATLLQMDQARLARVLAPKLQGSWNLHRLTHAQELDFFVLFSSAAPLLGLPGQANYAAANAFLDALAHHRRARDLPALSINWGPWSEAGLAAAREDRGSRLERLGLGSLSPEQGIGALEALLRTPAAQCGVLRLDAERWCASYPAATASPFLAALRESEPSVAEPEPTTDGIRATVLAARSARERQALLETHLRERVAQVLRLSAERVTLAQPFKALGMDSLMTLELRNRLEADLGIPLSASTIWNYPTVAALARHLDQQLNGASPDPVPTAAAAPRTEHPTPAAVVVDGLGHEQIEALLDRELAAIDELLYGE